MTDAQVKVGVDTSEGVAELKKLERASKAAKDELSNFDKVVNTTFGARNVFQITNFNRALTSMVDTLKTVSIVLVGANTAILAFFGAVVKELNKLQGFLSIMTLSTKSVKDANVEFAFLRDTANTLGIDLNVLTANYAKLVAAIPDGNEKFATAHKLFTGLAMAARTLHASTLDTQLMFYAVTQMASKGVISMEELRRQLGERLPGAMEIAARSLNTTTSALEKAIRTGTVQSAPFLKYFGDELIRTFAASADIAANTVDAALNRLRNVWIDFIKSVLDSGAGNAIVQVFDALRQKLSDPYLINTFATVIGDLATKVADFVKSLSSQDILNAFSTLKTGIEFVVTATLKLIEAMSWVVNNSRTVGAVLGGLFGAAKGAAVGFMFGGPTGALIGAGIGGAAGAAGGYYVGTQMAPNERDTSSFDRANAQAAIQQAELQRQTAIMLQSISGALQGLGFSKTDLESLLPMIQKRMGFNVETAGKFASILQDPKYKNLQERQAAALSLSAYGQLLGPRGTLEEVIGGAGSDKGKKKGKEPKLTHKDDLKEGLQYIEMLQRMLVKEEQLTEVEKLWRAVAEGRVAFNSEENFLRAKSIAQKIDEANATQALTKAVASLNDEYQDSIDKITDQYNRGTMTRDEQEKFQALRDFDQKVLQALARTTIPEVRAEIEALAKTMRIDLGNAIDEINGKMRTFEYGWAAALKTYVDETSNAAIMAADIFQTTTQAIEDQLMNVVKTGKFSMKELANTIMFEIARVGIRKGTGILMDFGTKIFQEMLRAILGSTINPYAMSTPQAGYAAGGRPPVGQISLVGENGPELFVPDRPGKIIPNHQMSSTSGQPIVINQNNYIDSRTDRAEIAMMLETNREATLVQLRDLINRRGF